LVDTTVSTGIGMAQVATVHSMEPVLPGLPVTLVGADTTPTDPKPQVLLPLTMLVAVAIYCSGKRDRPG
jgi:hypothetical protein